MGIIQDIFNSAIKEACTLENSVTSIIKRRLQLIGIDLDLPQLDKIKNELKTIGIENFRLNIDDKYIPKGFNKKDLDIELTEDDVDIFDKNLTKRIEQAIPNIVDDISPMIFEEIKRDILKITKSDLKERKVFEKNIFEQWGKALNLLQLFINIALEAGNDFNNEFREEAVKENDYVFEVLIRLQARACQVASEILVLLKSGYADGAHARWRCLHEIAVISFFISSNNKEVAERYMLHEAIESFKAAKVYQTHCKKLGYEPLSEKELYEITSIKNDLVKKFGKTYKEDYGWAEIVLNTARPKFSDIEQYVGLDYLRPFYKMASHNIHANPKGVFFKLGLYPTDPEILLAGPSNLGIADPGQGTALSLLQVTVCLLTSKPNMDALIICDILRRLEDEIGQTFLEIHASIENNILHE
jgi:hypothetical protein